MGEVIFALLVFFLIAISGLIYSIHSTLSAPVIPEYRDSLERNQGIPMQHCLIIQSDDQIQSDFLSTRKDYRIITLSRDIIIFGRSKTSDVVLDDPRVSMMHFRIDRNGNNFAVSDLGSRNGTFVNDQNLNHSRLLKNGDIISAGRFKAVFMTDDTIEQ